MQLQTVWPAHCRAAIASKIQATPLSAVWSRDGSFYKIRLTRTLSSSQEASNEKIQESALNPREVKTPKFLKHCNSYQI